MKASLVAMAAVLAAPAIAQAGNVTNNAIYGSGNANGSWTIDRANGVELALRGKLRHNGVGQPENTFNWDGVDTYTFDPGVAVGQSFPTGVWSFEWSINSNYTGGSGFDLDDLTYSLSATGPGGAFMTAFDPINGINPAVGVVAWDHSIGTNATGNGAGVEAASEAGYAALIAANNLAQNSWKAHWYISNYNPNTPGDYVFTLSAFDGTNKLAETSMTVTVVPAPPAVWLGLGLLGMLGVTTRLRRKPIA